MIKYSKKLIIQDIIYNIYNNKYNNYYNNLMNRENINNKILSALIIKKLPEDVFISTMTICCELDIQFNVDNIAKYIDLQSGGIISISYGRDGDPLTNRSLVPKKKKKKKNKAKKKQKREFHNQISLNILQM